MTTNGGSLADNISRALGLPDGWRPLYRDVVTKIAAIDPDAKVVDAKEKFGELRIYMKRYDEQIYALIDQANGQSRRICQMCGQAGVLSRTSDGFYATVCESHGTDFTPVTESRLRHVRLVLPAKDRKTW